MRHSDPSHPYRSSPFTLSTRGRVAMISHQHRRARLYSTRRRGARQNHSKPVQRSSVQISPHFAAKRCRSKLCQGWPDKHGRTLVVPCAFFRLSPPGKRRRLKNFFLACHHSPKTKTLPVRWEGGVGDAESDAGNRLSNRARVLDSTADDGDGFVGRSSIANFDPPRTSSSC